MLKVDNELDIWRHLLDQPIPAADTQHQFPHTRSRAHTHLGRGLKGWVHSNLWHVPVVDVLVAVPHTVDQVSLVGKKNGIKQNRFPLRIKPTEVTCFYLKDDEEGEEDQHKQQQAAGVHRQQAVLVREVRLHHQI